ncbi:MAG: efflux RND transporter periplasmic adaptor subunit [Pseudomonadota bacterium]
MATNYLELNAHHFRTLGSIRVPRIMKAVSWMLVLGSIGVIVFAIFTPWVQTTQGFGTVTSVNPNDRLQEINALVSGRIQEFYVNDGSHVKAGDRIVRIVDNDEKLLERLDAERAQVSAQVDAARTAAETAEIDLRRTQQLFDEGLAARRELEQARIKVEELKVKVAEAIAELTRVDVNISRQSVQIVHAPRDGVIFRVNAGDTATFVSSGQTIATFVPDNVKRAVELYIDGRDVALVRVGAKVRLEFEGWPMIQFSGWPSVAYGTFGGRVIAVDPSAQVSGRFRVLVEEDPEDDHAWPSADFVRFGSKARGWILLNEVSVGFEIWRQLNNFPPNFPGGQVYSAPASE